MRRTFKNKLEFLSYPYLLFLFFYLIKMSREKSMAVLLTETRLEFHLYMPSVPCSASSVARPYSAYYAKVNIEL